MVLLKDFDRDGVLDLVAQSPEYHFNAIAYFRGKGDGHFESVVTIPVQQEPRWIASGDLNEDGLQDLVITQLWSTVTILLSDDNGHLFKKRLILKAGTYLQNPLLVDFNLDGHLDLAIPDATRKEVKILQGNGNGGFSSIQHLKLSESPTWIVSQQIDADAHPDLIVSTEKQVIIFKALAGLQFRQTYEFSLPNSVRLVLAGDLNRDGISDLVILHGNSEYELMNFSLFVGESNGSFLKKVTYSYPEMAFLAMADLNKDGAPDLISTGHHSTMAVWLNHGDLTFAPPVPYWVRPHGETVSLGDFNGDGALDAVVGESIGPIALVVGRPDGTFIAERRPSVDQSIAWTTSVAAADLNGDGFTDLAAGVENLQVQFGRGNGKFQQLTYYGIGGAISMLRAADLNVDGRPDLVVVTGDGDAIMPLINTGSSFQRVQKLNANATSLVLADFNGDQKPDLVTFGDSGAMLCFGRGDGTFFPGRTLLNEAESGAAFDFDHDGKMDLAVGSGNTLLWLANNGDGTFASRTLSEFTESFISVAAGNSTSGASFVAGLDEVGDILLFSISTGGEISDPAYLFAGEYSGPMGSADLNSDSADDLYVVNRFDPSVLLLINRTAGASPAFEYDGNFETGRRPVDVAVADFDRDGDQDMAVSNGETGLSLLLNKTAQCPMK